MEIMQGINTNFVIWSMLDGDHALKANTSFLDQKLIKEPNFSSKLENKLRLEVFRSKRNWIYEMLKDNSVCIAKFKFDEMLKFNSCYTAVSFEQFLDNYHISKLTNKGFSITRKEKDNVEKSLDAIKDVEKRMESLEKDYLKYKEKPLKYTKIASHKFLNTNDCWLATNRALIVKTKDGPTKIVDGTHRLLAYGLMSRINKIENAELYAFYWEE